MEDKYIYFYKDIDLYKTEQFGAFCYELMELIQIAKLLDRVLVAPNVFVSPRNNKKIVETQHIFLKSLSYVPLDYFLDTNILEKYIKILPLAEFYEITYSNDNLLLHNLDNYKTILNDNNLITQFGKIVITDNYKLNCNFSEILQSINLLKGVKNRVMIVYNYGRLGQPNWHNANNLDYKLIRCSLKFPEFLYNKANNFINENSLNTNNSLIVHWRVGDRSITHNGTYEIFESETFNYYSKFANLMSPLNIIKNILEIKLKHTEITTIFLVHNNANNKELEFLISELGKFGLKILSFTYDIEPFSEQYEGMIQQLIGAKCKYQLYGPSCYERMSAFGRWIIEETQCNNLQPITYFIN
jgi:hypothetical protein